MAHGAKECQVIEWIDMNLCRDLDPLQYIMRDD
jgi:hypothetical protein